jgi:2-phosphoglycerate kinase
MAAVHPQTIREDLSHVRWICGSSCSGKTTIARKLASECDIDVYQMDLYFGDYIQHAAKEEHPHIYERFLQGSYFDAVYWPKEKRRAVNIGVLQEFFCLTIENLRHFGEKPIVLVEGLFLPEMVHEVSPKENAVCIAVTDGFYPETFKERRENLQEGQQGYSSEGEEWLRTFLDSERQKWLRAHLDDADRLDNDNPEVWSWIRDHMVEGARKAGIRVIKNDGSKSIDELTEIVKESLQL